RDSVSGCMALSVMDIEASTFALASPSTSPTEPIMFSITDRGGISLKTLGTASGELRAASIQPDVGSTTPSGLAILEFRQNGILIGETAFPASRSILSGRVYAEVD